MMIMIVYIGIYEVET